MQVWVQVCPKVPAGYPCRSLDVATAYILVQRTNNKSKSHQYESVQVRMKEDRYEMICIAQECTAMSHIKNKPINSADSDESSINHETCVHAVSIIDRDLDELRDEWNES